MSLCKVNGLFRLTRDAEMVTTQSGSVVVKLGLACSEKYKDKETQLFLDAVAFGKTGEIISQYAGNKGSQIFLSGKLQTDTWQDKQSGQNRSKVSMTIESFDFVSNKGGQQEQKPYVAPTPTYQNAQGQPVPPPQRQPEYPPEININEDEVPF